MSNYRPISVLTSFSKIFGKEIYARLYQHLTDNSILVNVQFGFSVNSYYSYASRFTVDSNR